MKYSFHPHAQQEAASALAYYTNIDPNLGRDFLSELDHCIDRILRRPTAWTPHWAGTRRCRMHRFPYVVVYKDLSEGIRIIAVMHQHRRPDYWLRRLKE